jgi:hypothetical protein
MIERCLLIFLISKSLFKFKGEAFHIFIHIKISKQLFHYFHFLFIKKKNNLKKTNVMITGSSF